MIGTVDEPSNLSSPSSSRNQRIGRALNRAVASAPWLWPVIRPAMRSFFDDLAEGWDERTRAGSPEHLAPLAAGLVKVEAPERALEIGTGTGTGALLIAREFPRARVRGVDISEEMIRRAKKRVGLDPEGRVAYRVADASSLPYEDESFDLVAELNMPPFFAEIARVLRPGGELRLIEHVRDPTSRARARAQDLLERPWGWVAGSCHPNRDTRATLAAAGFDTAAIEPGEFEAAGPIVKPLIVGQALPPHG
jgi:ubiquinone/menaquinone biosynthesis C-methylase UbiE